MWMVRHLNYMNIYVVVYIKIVWVMNEMLYFGSCEWMNLCDLYKKINKKYLCLAVY